MINCFKPVQHVNFLFGGVCSPLESGFVILIAFVCFYLWISTLFHSLPRMTYFLALPFQIYFLLQNGLKVPAYRSNIVMKHLFHILRTYICCSFYSLILFSLSVYRNIRMYTYPKYCLLFIRSILEFANKKEILGSSLSNILVLVKKIEL